MKIKFVFPKNYKYNIKILGFIDYKTAAIDSILGVIIFFIVHTLFKSISTQVYIFISLFLPILLFSILGTNGENIIEFSLYIIKFFKNRKVYFYEKSGSKENKT